MFFAMKFMGCKSSLQLETLQCGKCEDGNSAGLIRW